MAEAYPDRDGRSYTDHGIETTLESISEGDQLYLDTDDEEHSGYYTFQHFTRDPDLHVTLTDEDGMTCGIRRCISDRDRLLFVDADTMLAETNVMDVTTDTPATPDEPTMPSPDEKAAESPTTAPEPEQAEPEPADGATDTDTESGTATVTAETVTIDGDGQRDLSDYHFDTDNADDEDDTAESEYLWSPNESETNTSTKTAQQDMSAYT